MVRLLTRNVMPWTARSRRDGVDGEELGEVRPSPERKETVASIPRFRDRFLLAEERVRRGGANGVFSWCSGGRRGPHA